jgi:hypothetical protein
MRCRLVPLCCVASTFVRCSALCVLAFRSQVRKRPSPTCPSPQSLARNRSSTQSGASAAQRAHRGNHGTRQDDRMHRPWTNHIVRTPSASRQVCMRPHPRHANSASQQWHDVQRVASRLGTSPTTDDQATTTMHDGMNHSGEAQTRVSMRASLGDVIGVARQLNSCRCSHSDSAVDSHPAISSSHGNVR